MGRLQTTVLRGALLVSANSTYYARMLAVVAAAAANDGALDYVQ